MIILFLSQSSPEILYGCFVVHLCSNSYWDICLTRNFWIFWITFIYLPTARLALCNNSHFTTLSFSRLSLLGSSRFKVPLPGQRFFPNLWTVVLKKIGKFAMWFFNISFEPSLSDLLVLRWVFPWVVLTFWAHLFPYMTWICTKMARFCLIECTEKQQHFKHTVLFCISLKITPIVFSLDEFLRFVSNGIPFESNSKKFEGNQILNLLVLNYTESRWLFVFFVKLWNQHLSHCMSLILCMLPPFFLTCSFLWTSQSVLYIQTIFMHHMLQQAEYIQLGAENQKS